MAKKSGRRKFARNTSICWPTSAESRKFSALPKQVAVFPKSTGAEALAGVVGEPGTNCTVHPLGRFNRHPRLCGMCGIGCRGDLHRAEQPGFDQCPARFVNLALVINLAAPPAHTPLDI